MLVLTRRTDEALIIDGDIEVVILEVANGRVKIGVAAPDDVEIFRDELVEEDRA